ncbi:hypothetical protein DY023_06620 [Microbacterium bovistercoris]|uniref:Uncharacterized protein n=1 Tax=Microbacterium bovistercoris TaxID=2293570 RepID=A0A371NWM1_9MICO|nr:hypothetical protein [Microbacterium bovistercoris]REJ06299.1 hypothetical protein DY023_06620 [Microbacterium bovistercoris]
MTNIVQQFLIGVDGWDGYSPTQSHRDNERIMNQIMSAVEAVVPEPKAVVGTTRGDNTFPLEIVALGSGVTVQIVGDISAQQQDVFIDVWPNATLESVRIDSTPLTTSNTIGIQERDTTFTLHFSWGSASITRYHGEEDERREWLKHYTTVLADR